MQNRVLLLVISCGVAISLEIPSFPCTVTDTSICTVSGIFQNETQLNFILTAPDVKGIDRVVIKASRIKFWTSDVCNSFPNLDKVTASRVGIEQFLTTSFANCTKLTHLDLSYNEIKEIGVATFQLLQKLDTLYLYNNNLTYFPADSIKGLNQLKKLALISNEIFDIDEEKIKTNCPKLVDFWFNDNNLRCDRIVKIKETLRRLNVSPFAYIAQARDRVEEVRKVEDIICLSDAQWVAAIHKSASDPKMIQVLLQKITTVEAMVTATNSSLLDKLFRAEDKMNTIQEEAKVRIQENVRQVEEVQERLVHIVAKVEDMHVQKSLEELNETFESFKEEVRLNLTVIEETMNIRIETLEESLFKNESEVAEMRVQEERDSDHWLILGVLIVNLVLFGVGFILVRTMVKGHVLSFFQEKAYDSNLL